MTDEQDTTTRSAALARPGACTPVFRIFDEAAARGFYCDYLGFAVDWEHRFEPDLPLYLQVTRGACRLHLSEHHGDACPGATVRIAIDDVARLLEELERKPYRYARPAIARQPWGNDLGLTDPFGNRLIFTDAG